MKKGERAVLIISLIILSAIILIFFARTIILKKSISGKTIEDISLPNTESCSDSDGGIFPYVKGNVNSKIYSWIIFGSYVNLTDSCRNETFLYEYYCSSNFLGQPSLKSKGISCKNYCFDGHCNKISIFDEFPKPIGYWKFDPESRNASHVFDVSGNENHGRLNEVAFEKNLFGEAIKSLNLNSYIEIPDKKSMFNGLQNFTIAFYAKVNDPERNQQYLHYGRNKGNSLLSYLFYQFKEVNYVNIINDSNEQFYLKTERPAPITPGSWFHYAFTHDSKECKIYVNGYLFEKIFCPIGKQFDINFTLFLLGGEFPYPALNGSLDEVMIFNQTLSQDEINKLLNGQIGCGDRMCSQGENSLTCYEDCFSEELTSLAFQDDELIAWYIDSSLKVLSSYNGQEMKSGIQRLNMAQNEIRYIQLALRSSSQRRINLNVETPENINVTIYLENEVEIINASSGNDYPYIGNVPDPLVKRNGVVLSSNKTSVFLIEIRTYPQTISGLNNLTIRLGGRVPQDFPFLIYVHNFSLPDKLSMRSAIDSGHFTTKFRTNLTCTENSLFDFHNISSKDEDSLQKLIKEYYTDFAQNKIAPYRVQIYNDFTYDCKKKVFNFEDLDDTLTYYIDSLKMNSFAIRSQGPNLESYRLCGVDIDNPEYENIAIPYFQNLSRHLEEKGWLDEAYIIVDEPRVSFGHMPYMISLANITLNKIFPPIKTGPALLSPQSYQILNNNINLWVILNDNAASGKWGENIFNETWTSKLNEQGEEIWWYFIEQNSFNIDSGAIDTIALPWTAWKYNISGILSWAGLFFDMHCFDKTKFFFENPWKTPRSEFGNGQVNLYYPPCIDKCKQPTFNVVPSLRLKLLREGIEDYEYMKILQDEIFKARKKGFDTTNADNILSEAGSLTYSSTSWSRDPSSYVRLRNKIANEIVRLQGEK